MLQGSERHQRRTAVATVVAVAALAIGATACGQGEEETEIDVICEKMHAEGVCLSFCLHFDKADESSPCVVTASVGPCGGTTSTGPPAVPGVGPPTEFGLDGDIEVGPNHTYAVGQLRTGGKIYTTKQHALPLDCL